MSKELFDKLIETKVKGSTGVTTFNLNETVTIVSDPSVVGLVIQEWLKTFMRKEGISFRSHENSQEPPDFFMDSTSDTKNLLEIKCFTNSPNFDIANFSSYVRGLLVKPYRLNSNYLIIKYNQRENDILVEDLWLKKVWEITGPSLGTTIRLQIKKGTIYNIRPINWYSDKSKFKPFDNLNDMLVAISKVVTMVPTLHDISKNWLSNVQKGYESYKDD